jgi:hypothetical protein
MELKKALLAEAEKAGVDSRGEGRSAVSVRALKDGHQDHAGKGFISENVGWFER